MLNTEETLSFCPGLLTQIYDGIQRPLATLEEVMGVFITRGVDADAFDMEKTWTFEPQVAKGDEVSAAKSSATSKKPRPSFTKSWSHPARAAR